MKKLIDIPDEILKDLKILAVQNDNSLKGYLENLISRHHEFSQITELARLADDDDQAHRVMVNYLQQTYDGIKDSTFWGSDPGKDDWKFENISEFYKFMQDVCEMGLEWVETDKEEDN